MAFLVGSRRAVGPAALGFAQSMIPKNGTPIPGKIVLRQ